MDVTSANIGISRQEFLQHLAASQLLSDAELERLAADANADAIQLANQLANSGKLTNFQIDAVSEGRPHDLRVGNYDILDRLGAGGMGTVFKARHRRMKRIVALKVLSAALCKDAAFVQRFQREVETVARLGHPNVVMAYDADEAEVGHFLVMEFVNGRDLASLVEKTGPLPVAQAIDCMLQAARGLAYAHSQGIIHRDVKPHNLLRDAAGAVKVTDLGLARLSGGPGDASGVAGLTQAGGVLGTVDYMPPEQAVDSTTIDARADIYSLGATLHYLLIGRPPFTGASLMAILLKHREAAIPSLTALRPDVPTELDNLFNRMMAKSPTDRFATMTEVVTALESLAGKHGQATASAPSALPPLGASPADSSVVLGSGGATIAVMPPKSGPLSVLVVEPSRVQAGIIRKYLEAQDVGVAGTIATGREAIDAVRANQPDAVVSALYLTDMTGVELATRLRAEIKPKAPGFVLVSSESEAGEAGSLSQLNRVVMLHKPFTPAQLVECLSTVTGQSIALKSTAVSVTAVSGVRPPMPQRDRSMLRVLIVDDSTPARTNVRGVLQRLGFGGFAEVADGAQAIAAAARERFDLIVTDYNMPLMDGHALVSYLKQTSATSAIPVIMVTTETDPKVLDPVRKLGVVAVVEKAFPAAVVKPIVEKLF
jgi:CheY-like chemotaxis protein